MRLERGHPIRNQKLALQHEGLLVTHPTTQHPQRHLNQLPSSIPTKLDRQCERQRIHRFININIPSPTSIQEKESYIVTHKWRNKQRSQLKR